MKKYKLEYQDYINAIIYFIEKDLEILIPIKPQKEKLEIWLDNWLDSFYDDIIQDIKDSF